METKILIDTNIFLDFYRSNKIAIKLFHELENHFDKIIITDQIILEFERSREIVLRAVKQNFDAESSIENFSSSFVQDLPEFQDLIAAQKNYSAKRKEVSNKISEIMANPSKDQIYSLFKTLVDRSIEEQTILMTTSEILNNANKRKLIGNPPTSNKFSIGDEINWEIILANATGNIVIVGRDNTYTNNISFLQRDFHKNTGFEILKVTDSITSALTEIGVKTSGDLAKEEKNFINSIESYSEYWKPKKGESSQPLF